MLFDRSRAYDRSHTFLQESGIQLESHLSTGAAHTIRVVPSDWSQAYDQSYVFRSESGIRPELGI
jgi:hypothetical protein